MQSLTGYAKRWVRIWVQWLKRSRKGTSDCGWEARFSWIDSDRILSSTWMGSHSSIRERLLCARKNPHYYFQSQKSLAKCLEMGKDWLTRLTHRMKHMRCCRGFKTGLKSGLWRLRRQIRQRFWMDWNRRRGPSEVWSQALLGRRFPGLLGVCLTMTNSGKKTLLPKRTVNALLILNKVKEKINEAKKVWTARRNSRKKMSKATRCIPGSRGKKWTGNNTEARSLGSQTMRTVMNF